MSALDRDDIAYGIVEDYLADGPEFIDVAENAADNGFDSDEDFEYIHNVVRGILSELRGSL